MQLLWQRRTVSIFSLSVLFPSLSLISNHFSSFHSDSSVLLSRILISIFDSTNSLFIRCFCWILFYLFFFVVLFFFAVVVYFPPLFFIGFMSAFLSLSLLHFLSLSLSLSLPILPFARMLHCSCLLLLIYSPSFWLTSMLLYGLLPRMFIVFIRLVTKEDVTNSLSTSHSPPHSALPPCYAL